MDHTVRQGRVTVVWDIKGGRMTLVTPGLLEPTVSPASIEEVDLDDDDDLLPLEMDDDERYTNVAFNNNGDISFIDANGHPFEFYLNRFQ
ncbi:hypothetical protein IAR50_003697 [Cryptococcus sp. DSM 104548]